MVLVTIAGIVVVYETIAAPTSVTLSVPGRVWVIPLTVSVNVTVMGAAKIATAGPGASPSFRRGRKRYVIVPRRNLPTPSLPVSWSAHGRMTLMSDLLFRRRLLLI